jgi:S1-C subfamily serine protease
MHRKVYRPFLLMTTFILVVGLACQLGSPSTPEPVQVTVEPPTQEVIPTDEPEEQQLQSSGAISSLDELDQAVVYIEAQGSFRDPSAGWQVNVGGSGSGFLIDQSGIAVTNNHVVAGSATLKVWLAGESDPRMARVLGVSECSDLAVIEIDGDDFPYLDWFQGDIKVGMDVYTAGYPISGAGIGYSLTKGIVSKASGSVAWTVAAVDQIIEHTAKVNPGNSGGPLVDQNARVVGVNFGFNETLDQNYSVERDEAIAVINQLRTGMDVDSLGVNGVAVDGELDGNAVVGIWVRSVKSGSPADKARIQPGDIILEVESKLLNDGTLGGYCEIVRSHKPTDTLNVTVLRADTLEILEGQFNGRELEYVSTLSGTSTTTSTGGAQGNPGATASGDIFFSTEFDSDDGLYPLAVPETDKFEVFTRDSLLYIEVKSKNSNVYTFYDMDLTNPDVRIDADVETVGGPNRNNISLVCRATDEGWYEFSMNSGGYWYIWKYEDGSYYRLADGASYAINLQKAANSLTATCIGRELTFYVNGTKMGSVSDNTFKNGGQVGVSVSTFNIPGAAVEFERLVATVP